MGTKARTVYMLCTRDPVKTKGHIQTEVNGKKKIFIANGNQKKVGVAILHDRKKNRL